MFKAANPSQAMSEDSKSYVECSIWILTVKCYTHGFSQCYTMRQPEKVGRVSPSSDAHVTLVVVPCCQLSYIPCVFKHYDLLVRKIIILCEVVCITLSSQNQNTT